MTIQPAPYRNILPPAPGYIVNHPFVVGMMKLADALKEAMREFQGKEK